MNETDLLEIAKHQQHRRTVEELKSDGEKVASRLAGLMMVGVKSNRIRYATDRASRIFGYGRDELTSDQPSLMDLIPTRYHERHVTHQAKFNKNPSDRQMGDRILDLFGRKKNGDEIKVEIGLLEPEMFGGELCTPVLVSLARQYPDPDPNESLKQSILEMDLRRGK